MLKEQSYTSSQSIYKLEKVCKTYIRGNQSLKILKDLNLSIHKGQFLCISGASGAGKSTLLHIMGTLDKPTSGSVFLKSGISQGFLLPNWLF